MSNVKHRELAGTGRVSVGKTAVVGAKHRATNQVAANLVRTTNKETLQTFVKDHATKGATVYSGEAKASDSPPLAHESVKNSVSEHARAKLTPTVCRPNGGSRIAI